MMSLSPGTLLGDRYVIDGVLGRGGFATVYAARHTQLASEHAIKVLHAGADEVSRARLLSEGRIQARLNHPNVVRVTDVVALPYGVGLVMDVIHGESLSARLGRGRVPLAEALALGEGLLRGVAAAHAVGLVHRDLKPENVLVDREGAPKVIDFGIARGEAPPGQTQAGIGMGTPGYMAPEAYHDVTSVGPAADVFALGVILYELLSGQRPFPAGAPWMQQLQLARQSAWPPLSARSLGLPQALIDAVHAALSPRAAERPPDAERLLACWLGQATPPTKGSTDTIQLDLGDSLAALPEPERAAPDDPPAPPAAQAEPTLSLELGAPAVAPPALTARNNLPAERDPFIGRARDLDALTAKLSAGARLVTLLGIGGVGKTRLGIHYAHQQLHAWPGGVWLCDLVDTHDLDGVLRAVAVALSVPLGRDAAAQLSHAIAGRGRCLVILDNFEQVTPLAQETVGRWLDAAPEARLLVTSRERLGLSGETVLLMAPFEEDDAVALFTARSAAAGGQLGPEDVPEVLALVRQLDQLPLAIELAAARVRMMSPAAMLSRMKDRFRLLSAPGGRLDRHATLRGTLDWSWELLSQDEQQALAQLAVFVGGFTLEAAEAVLDVGDAWPADLLQSLVDKSLLRAVPLGRGDGRRFELLASVAEYAAARLDQLGGRAAAEARHGLWYTMSGHEDAITALYRHGGLRLRRLLGRELDNLLAALHRAVARGDGEVAAGCLRAAWEVIQLRGPLSGGVALTAEVLRIPTLSDRARGTVLRAHADALRVMGRVTEAMVHAEEARALFAQLGERKLESAMIGRIGALLYAQGRVTEAEELCHTALRLARAYGAPRVEGGMLRLLGAQTLQQGRYDEARTLLDEDLAHARSHGDLRSEGAALSNRAVYLMLCGEHGQALEHLTQALTIARESENQPFEVRCLINLGMLRQRLGQHAEARLVLESALRITRDIGARHQEGVTLGALAATSLVERRLDAADREAAGGEQILRAMGDKVELAKLLCVWSRLHHARRDPEKAAAALAEAEALAAALSVTPESELGQAVAQARAVLG